MSEITTSVLIDGVALPEWLSDAIEDVKLALHDLAVASTRMRKVRERAVIAAAARLHVVTYDQGWEYPEAWAEMETREQARRHMGWKDEMYDQVVQEREAKRKGYRRTIGELAGEKEVAID